MNPIFRSKLLFSVLQSAFGGGDGAGVVAKEEEEEDVHVLQKTVRVLLGGEMGVMKDRQSW
jgi:hypothetical protein